MGFVEEKQEERFGGFTYGAGAGDEYYLESSELCGQSSTLIAVLSGKVSIAPPESAISWEADSGVEEWMSTHETSSM